MNFIKINEPDYISFGILFRNLLLSISYAKEKGDWWRNDQEEDVKFGLMIQQGDVATGYSFIIGRVKLNVVFRNPDGDGDFSLGWKG